MADVFLIFPPDSIEVNEPCINTTELAAYLKQQGLSVRQIDANIMFQNAIYSPEEFMSQRAFCKNICKEFQTEPKEVAWLYQADPQKLLSSLQIALSGIRSKEKYYEFSYYYQYKAVHYRYLNAIHQMTHMCIQKQQYETLADIETIISHGTPYDKFLNETLLPDILCEKPVLADIFVTTYNQLIPALILSMRLRSHGCHTVLSGILPTHIRNDLLHMPEFFAYTDGVVLYEQEKTIPALLKQIQTGKGFDSVPNFVYCSEDHVYQTEIVEPLPMDDLPVPDFSDFDYALYLTAEKAVPYSASRGCEWGKCKFCHLHKDASVYVEKSSNKIADDLAELKKQYSGTVLFYDCVFLPDRLLELANALIEKKLDIKWTAIVKHTRLISEKEAQILFQSGLRLMENEYESENPLVHKEMDTGISLDIFWENLRNVRAAGIINTMSVLIGGCKDNCTAFSKTCDTIAEHKDIVNAVITFQQYIAKDSDLYNSGSEYAIDFQHTFPDVRDTYHQYAGPDWMSQREKNSCADLLFQTTASVYPYFQISYFPIMNYVNHYHCHDPLKLVEYGDHRVTDKRIIPSPHPFIITLSAENTSGNPILYNLINGKHMESSETLNTLLRLIDDASDVAAVIEKAAAHDMLDINTAYIKYLSVLSRYRSFMV